MKMQRSQRVKGILSIIVGVLLFYNQLVFAMEPSISVLGDVVGSGNAETKGAFNRWIAVGGKAFPVVDGATLRSRDGMMSVIFRDGARIEIGKNSEALINGKKGNYTVTIGSGTVAFSVPKGISFTVATPNAAVQTQVTPNMIQKVSLASQDDIRGVVSYDGKGTKVISVSGTVMVKDTKGAGLQTVSAGNAVYIAAADSGKGITPVQVVEDTVPVTGGSPLLITGGSILGMGGAYLGVNSTYNGGNTASPSKP